jgi:hypothetical protein
MCTTLGIYNLLLNFFKHGLVLRCSCCAYYAKQCVPGVFLQRKTNHSSLLGRTITVEFVQNEAGVRAEADRGDDRGRGRRYVVLVLTNM